VKQYDAKSAPSFGLVLVSTRPAVRGGIGQIALWIDGEAQADLDLAMCGRACVP
jgi:hypothetical protein